MDPNKVEIEKTGKSTLLFLVFGLIIAAIVAGVIIIFVKNPDITKEVFKVVLIIVGAIILIIAAIAVLMFLLALPYYASKGSVTQTDMSYDMDDVKPVESVTEAKYTDDKKEQ